MSAKRPPFAPDGLDRHLGRRLARRRRELCLTLDELEQRIGAAPGTIIQIEKGTKRVGAAELVALASTLGVSVAWFFADPPPGSAADAGAAPVPESIVEAERFLAFYYRINDPKIRRDILGLIKAAATE
jgi:transcriptional regulator with XRE-family HTH domain